MGEEGPSRVLLCELIRESDLVRKVSRVVDGKNEVGTKGVYDEEDEFRMGWRKGAGGVEVAGSSDRVALVHLRDGLASEEEAAGEEIETCAMEKREEGESEDEN